MTIFMGENEKWINKGNDKNEGVDCLLHITQYLFQISKS